MDNKIVVYSAVIVVVAVLAWSITTMANGFKSNPQYQYYQNLAKQSDSGCGDLTETGNIQHLSHHPEQYVECIKKVDPQKFKEVVGQDMDSFLKSKGL